LATGQPHGAYYNIGRKLRDVIEKALPNVCLEILQTNGALANLELLKTGRVDLALVQNDVIAAARNTVSAAEYKLVLGLTQESLQIIVGPDITTDSLSSIKARRIAIGLPNSGTNFTAKNLLDKFNIPIQEVPIQQYPNVVEVLHDHVAQGEFFITSAPNPNVSMLLADPYFRLLSLETPEIEALKQAPYYSVTTIEEHTYPHQSRQVTTIAVTALLMCRRELDPAIVKSLTNAVLGDVDSANSTIRASLSEISLRSVLTLTREAQNAPVATLHIGAGRALQDVSFLRRHADAFEFLSWAFLLLLSLAMLAVSHFRSLRLLLLRLITDPVHFSLYRVLTRGLNLVTTVIGNPSNTARNSWALRRLDRIPEKAYRSLRRLFFNRILWQVVRTVSLVIVVWLIASISMYYAEHRDNANFASLKDALVSDLVYMFSGLEDRAPVTNRGWFVAVLILLLGLLLVAYITGQFASEIVQSTRGAKKMTSISIEGGFLLVGWNARAELVVSELFGAFEAGFGEHRIVVLLNDKNKPPMSSNEDPSVIRQEERGVTFFPGDPADPAVLQRCRAGLARAVIFISDDSTADPDATTALAILSLRRIARREGRVDRGPLICAEVKDKRNIELFREAGADEVVCHEDYGLGILVQSALGTRISRVFHELLSYQQNGCEIYFLEISRSFVSTEFTDVAGELRAGLLGTDNPVIPIGVQRGDEIHLNPRGKFSLQIGDKLIVIAWNRPAGANLELLSRVKRAATA
jgi:TRAP transporter TAXI family solute receptor